MQLVRNVCPTRYMSRTEFTTVKMGEHDHHKYSAREHHARCGSHMMGHAQAVSSAMRWSMIRTTCAPWVSCRKWPPSAMRSTLACG